MKKVSIIGLGLMGGSLGMALKARGLAERVVGYARRTETRRLAVEKNVVDRAFDSPEAAVKGADLVVFCTPILSIPPLARACEPQLAPGCLVTDVGSTKTTLGRELQAILAHGRGLFVGSHPMTGSEQAGIDAARADLYEGAVVVVAPDAQADRQATATLVRFWEALGSRVVLTDPETHDRMVARTSHIPHLVAAALVSSVGREGIKDIRDFCGPGFRDTTRVAEGSPEVWMDILKTNREGVLRELRAFEGRVHGIAGMLDSGRFKEVQEFLEEAKRKREELFRREPK